MFNQKGQGSLEYLLILGGAILVAVIIIAAITSLPANNPAAYTSMVGTCQTASLNQTVCESDNLQLKIESVLAEAGVAANTMRGRAIAAQVAQLDQLIAANQAAAFA
jgi:uncharacterized protein (UPF0333 family)